MATENEPVKHSVIASTFADLADLAAFRKCKAQGKSDKECFKTGDNGLGLWGDNTAQEITPMVALPPEIMIEKWGSDARHKPLIVEYKDRQCRCIVGDRMPHLANLRTNARIDLNPAAVKVLGIPKGGMVRVTWWWL